MLTGNVDYLSKHGPTPVDELPCELTPQNRAQGLHFFEIHGHRGDVDRMGGTITRIAFLPKHDPDRVLRTFVNTNPQLVKHKTRRGLSQMIGDHGRQWKQAATEVLGDYYESTGGRGGGDRDSGETDECPFCGEEVLKGSLPDHLAGECSR
ncbi:hypothetical protein ACFQE1_03540 [Halobium palmae]|uniref:Uncharacterized protein n=1 Tax=Halobium palmae TaxID=1776492 RepID=A0ABD5RWC7_9EURY